MRFRLAPAAALVVLAAAVAAAPGCRGMAVAWNKVAQKGDLITYEQYQAIDTAASPPLSVQDVLDRLGKPMEIHDRNGARMRLDYHAFGMDDSMKRAEFHFDKNERLTKKELW